MYKQGDFVLTTSWWEGEEVRSDLPNVALVTGHKAGKLTLRYFYRPHQTFRKATQTFAIGELLLTNKTSVVAPGSITGRCAVLSLKSYLVHTVEGLDDSVVMFCRMAYNPETKGFTDHAFSARSVRPPKDLKALPEQRELQTVVNPKDAAKDAKPQEFAVAGVPITFVSDAEIPIHFVNLVATPTARPPQKARDTRRAIKTALMTDHDEQVDSQSDMDLGDKRELPFMDEDTDQSSGSLDGRKLYSLTQRTRKRRAPPPKDPDDPNNDHCEECSRGGKLVCCDSCPRAFHPRCIKLDLASLEDDQDWFCSYCLRKASGKRRRTDNKKKAPVTEKRSRGIARHVLEDESGNDSSSEGDMTVTEESDDDGDDEDKAETKERKMSETRKQQTDSYFKSHSRASKTSNRTLAKIPAARMDEQTLYTRLSALRPGHKKERKALIDRHRKHFPAWQSQLQIGFNILVHGFGSKKELLLEFAADQLSDVACVAVDGHSQICSIKQILNFITAKVHGYEDGFRNTMDQVNFILELYEDDAAEALYIILHNVDGPALRNDSAQTALSYLANCHKIHIVASQDHINAGLLWDHASLGRFNWVHYNCTTFSSYALEASLSSAIAVGSQSLTIDGIKAVLTSLSQRAQRAFWILAEYQRQNCPLPGYKGLAKADFQAMCQEQFVAHDSMALQGFLNEFYDHKLMESKKHHGVEKLTVPCEPDFLETVIMTLEEFFPSARPEEF